MVDSYADKLLIGLTKEENEMVLNEFDEIDRNLEEMTELEGIKDAEPMSWCLDRVVTDLRDDVAEESIPIDDALKNSDRTTDREIEIERVVG